MCDHYTIKKVDQLKHQEVNLSYVRCQMFAITLLLSYYTRKDRVCLMQCPLKCSVEWDVLIGTTKESNCPTYRPSLKKSSEGDWVRIPKTYSRLYLSSDLEQFFSQLKHLQEIKEMDGTVCWIVYCNNFWHANKHDTRKLISLPLSSLKSSKYHLDSLYSLTKKPNSSSFLFTFTEHQEINLTDGEKDLGGLHGKYFAALH